MLWINIPKMHVFWIIQEDSTLFSNANVCWFAQKKKANPMCVSSQINVGEHWGTSNNSQLLQIDQCQIHYQILSKSVLWRSLKLRRKSPPIVNEMFPSQSFIEDDYSEKRLKNHSSEHQAVIISDLSAASSQCCRYCCCVSLVLRQTAHFYHKKKAAESWHSMMTAWHQLQRDHVQTSSCEHTLTSLIEGQECPNWSSFKRREIYFYCSRKESYF